MKIELKGIYKSFRQGAEDEFELQILRDLNFQVQDGETVALVGESGSGKSTLLALLAGFEQPDRGEIVFAGKSTHDWNERDWATLRKEKLGFVFQEYHLIPYLSALENVALPLRLLGQPGLAAERAAEQSLQCVGLAARLQHLPSQLSGGEAQRVAMARALIHQPQLILADEPTGSLDSKTGAQVLSVFFELVRARSAVVVTHSLEVARRCDRVLTLREGSLWPTSI